MEAFRKPYVDAALVELFGDADVNAEKWKQDPDKYAVNFPWAPRETFRSRLTAADQERLDAAVQQVDAES